MGARHNNPKNELLTIFPRDGNKVILSKDSMKYKGSLHIARTKVEQWGKAFSYVDHHRNRRSFSWEKQTLVIIGMCFTSEYGSISLPLVLSKASLDLSQCVSRRFKCYTAMAYELACLVGSEQISMHKESSPQRL